MAKGLNWPKRHVRAWYTYGFASEVFAANALSIFLPLVLERMAREVGYLSPDYTVPCDSVPKGEWDGRNCKALFLGVKLDTASFSMYVKSVAVALQALCIISVGPLADNGHLRRRILLFCTYAGAISGTLFLFFPSAPNSALPLVAALLMVFGNVFYSISMVCANAYLPFLAKEDPVVAALSRGEVGNAEGRGGYTDSAEHDEAQNLLPSAAVAPPRGPPGLAAVVTSLSTQDLAHAPTEPTPPPATTYQTLLSLTISRISSMGIALGFLSGLLVLVLLTIPIKLMGGTTQSMRVAVGISGLWWGVFAAPACIGLPKAEGDVHQKRKGGVTIKEGWKRMLGMIKPREIRALPNLFTFLLAWIFLSDGFHTTSFISILYASATLGMGPSQIILIGVLVQLCGVVSSVLAPRLQRRLGMTNLKFLIMLVLLAELIPIYACAGLLLPWGGLRTAGELYVAASWFGVLYGPFNSYARAVYAELIPSGHESSYFSLYSLTDKSSSFVGPAVVGAISDITGNIRYGFLFLLLMLAVPVPVLMRVQVGRGGVEAAEWAISKKREGSNGADEALLRSERE